MNNSINIWQVIITLFIAVMGVLVQLYISYKNREQIETNTYKNNDTQKFISHRSIATFIADKRQKWIDELRNDMALHLALSQEIMWKWDAIRSLMVEKTKGISDDEKDKILQERAELFSKENGERDKVHHEQYFRIKFRLNPNEPKHKDLRITLDNIRKFLHDLQSASSKGDAKKLEYEIEKLIYEASCYTDFILKEEWNRIKREVTNPQKELIENIKQT